MNISDLANLPSRNFTTSEEADISCNLPEYCELSEYRLEHTTGEVLHAVGDNLYRITRNGKVEFYDNLMLAVDSL
jgi:hypothetical protein